VRLERVRDLPAACFHPVPKVTSTLVRATPLETAPIPARPDGHDALGDVERVVRAAFGTRRKTLVNALRTGLEPPPAAEELHAALDALGIDGRRRAETLAPEDFLALARALRGCGAPDQ
jgi:16S rRNA (adenine1518-N6/adenine1519-N6)-dimethyltransferase